MQIFIRKQTRTCYPCLEAQISLKIRAGFRNNGSLLHGDRAVLAFSGGPCSSLLLHFLQVQRDTQADRWDKMNMAFDLTVVHIVEDFHTATDATSARRDLDLAAASIAAKIINTDITFQLIPLSDVFISEESDAARRQEKLTHLVAAIADITAKQDLLSYFRLRLLLDRCKALECTKLLWGHNTTAFAVRAVASTVKGAGYALPGNAQHVDCRHVAAGGPMMGYPLKDIPDEEIDVICSRLGLFSLSGAAAEKQQQREEESGGEGRAVTVNKHDINELAAAFIQNVLKHNPGAINNINSTVSKLEAFDWNEPVNEKQQRGAVKGTQHVAEVLCSLCYAPLADAEVCAIRDDDTDGGGALTGVCESCKNEIFRSREEGDGATVMALMPDCIRREIAEKRAAWLVVRERCSSGGSAADLKREMASL